MTTKTLYAAQVRDMHTAVHNLIIFPERPAALKALKEVHQTQCWPQHAGPARDVAEINFRAPPTEFKGHRLCIVNGKYKTPQGVPDPDGHPNSPTYGHLKLPHLN